MVISNFLSSVVGNNKTTNILWTGHRIQSTSSSGDINENRSCSFRYCIFMLALVSNLEENEHEGVLLHELAHQYGALDHYHELDADGNCKFADRCSDRNENQRPRTCIMYDSDVSIYSDTVFCEWCVEDILKHLEEHH